MRTIIQEEQRGPHRSCFFCASKVRGFQFSRLLLCVRRRKVRENESSVGIISRNQIRA